MNAPEHPARGSDWSRAAWDEIRALRLTIEAFDARNREMRELVVRLETRLEHLTTTLAGALADPGTPRCASRGERIEQVERRLELLAELPGNAASCQEQRDRLLFLEEKLGQLISRLWWYAATTASAVLMLGLKSLWEVLTS